MMDQVIAWFDGNPNDLIYRCEGNSSIVFSWSGRGKVLRLLKRPKSVVERGLYQDERDIHDSEQKHSVSYINEVIRPLIKQFIGSTCQVVKVCSQIVMSLMIKVESQRPITRFTKDLPNEDQYGLLMDDLCTLPEHALRNFRSDDMCGPVISIEIKPKQACLPSLVLDTSHGMDAQLISRCLYVSMQSVKLARGQVDRVSSYCPVKLFSGCPRRMFDSIRALLVDPQNNFRIFRNSELAYKEDSNPEDLVGILDGFRGRSDEPVDVALINMITKCLLNNNLNPLDDSKPLYFKTQLCSRHDKCCLSNCCPAGIMHKLSSSCVLSSVLKLQNLDTIGSMKALSILNYLIDNGFIEGTEQLSKLVDLPKNCGAIKQSISETPDEFKFRKLREFLISLTGKDCSIIMTMRRISPSRQEDLASRRQLLGRYLLEDSVSGSLYVYNVGLADLDSKTPSSIHKQCEDLRQMIQLETILRQYEDD